MLHFSPFFPSKLYIFLAFQSKHFLSMKRLVNYTQTVLLRLLQSRRLFPLWLKLNHYSCVFLNFYRGAAPVNLSGESYIIQYVSSSKRRHDSPAIIIDVGANRDEYSDLVLHYFDDTIKVFLFEPTHSLQRANK